jgi:predicted nucleotidyltransferase
MSKLRAALKSYQVGKTELLDYGCLSGVKLTSGAAGALLGEAYLRGLVGLVDDEGMPAADGGFGLTRAGLAVAAATARKRIQKDKAKVILDKVLSKADELSRDKVAPIKISRIWVFGSYIDPRRKDVGDLDVVIETQFTDVQGTRDFRTRLAYVRKQYPDLLPSGFDPIFGNMDGYFVDRYIYGARRPGLIAPNDVHTLCSLGCPCALYFDIDRGGIIQPDFLHRHPDSAGRSNHILDKLAMPEFPPMGKYEFTPAVVATGAFANRGMPPKIDIETWSDDTTIQETFLLDSHSWRAPVKMTRRLTFGPTAWSYDAVLDMPSGMSRGGKKVGELYPPDIRGVLDLMHADLLRLAAFREEQGAMVSIIADAELSKTVNSWVDDHDRWRFGNLIEDHKSLDLDAVPDLYSWGLHCSVDGAGTGYIGPDDMVEDEIWEDFEFPFSEERYLEWKSTVEGTGRKPTTGPKP